MGNREENIKEIAELILCGHLCFLNIKTGSFEYHPFEMDFYDEEENPWQDVIKKVENNRDEYIEIEPMDSRRSFAVMQAFAEQLESDGFREKLLNALSRAKPFGNFKYLLHNSDFRQDWFDFEQIQSVEWVKKQINYRES